MRLSFLGSVRREGERGGGEKEEGGGGSTRRVRLLYSSFLFWKTVVERFSRSSNNRSQFRKGGEGRGGKERGGGEPPLYSSPVQRNPHAQGGIPGRTHLFRTGSVVRKRGGEEGDIFDFRVIRSDDLYTSAVNCGGAAVNA